MYIISTIPHGKCFVRYLRTRCFCTRNLTRSLRSLVRFLIRQQLVRKYRTPALSMKYSLFSKYLKNALIEFVQTLPQMRQLWQVQTSLSNFLKKLLVQRNKKINKKRNGVVTLLWRLRLQ